MSDSSRLLSVILDAAQPAGNSEIDSFMDKLGGTKPAAKDAPAAQRPKKSSRRHLLNNLFDFIAIAASETPLRSTRSIFFSPLLAVACLVFAVIYFVVKPFQRGFFCDDTSIQYPYKHDTIPMWLLAVYGGLGPIIIVSKTIRESNVFIRRSISSSSWRFGSFARSIVGGREAVTR